MQNIVPYIHVTFHMDNKHPGIFSVIKDTILPRSTVDEFTINIETFQNKVGTQARVVGISAIDLQILTLIYEIKAWDIAFFPPGLDYSNLAVSTIYKQLVIFRWLWAVTSNRSITVPTLFNSGCVFFFLLWYPFLSSDRGREKKWRKKQVASCISWRINSF